ncbi:MAG: crossover junction endodeoxyribonuclease RuvC [Pseudomonadota bacterium]|nr:crossover junction endodeoxyribonuclease RuvC [Pseudomonadota bacterium]MEC9235791.1 crossover junction endodeoxyribonuclease RuvC [Pseudomonadota bacterium]MEE3322399.1 crossover junction endodeoxyribonuclease RuvC [Pseudomonadota bacterium]
MQITRVLGVDPGLNKTGWGVVEFRSGLLRFIGSGLIRTKPVDATGKRLVLIDEELRKVIESFAVDEAAVEETFVNQNPASALKLGQARGVCLMAAARTGIDVGEYAPTVIKKSVVGTGRATKDQMGMMIKTLLPAIGKISEDEADALAVAICHGHHLQSKIMQHNSRAF